MLPHRKLQYSWPSLTKGFEAGVDLAHNVHVMITSKNVVADRYDVVKSTGCCKEQHHGCKRKDNCSVVSLYRGIDAIHDATPVQAT